MTIIMLLKAETGRKGGIVGIVATSVSGSDNHQDAFILGVLYCSFKLTAVQSDIPAGVYDLGSRIHGVNNGLCGIAGCWWVSRIDELYRQQPDR